MLKTKFYLLIIIMIISASSLSAQSEKISSIGSIISTKDAASWTENYKTKIGGVESHLYGKETLQKLIEPSYVEGVYIFKGLDQNEIEHLIFYRSDADGKLVDTGTPTNAGKPCPPYCSVQEEKQEAIATIGGEISGELAAEMINRYQSKYPKRLRAQLYGKDLFETLLSDKDVAGLFVINALDNNQQERFVLMATTKDGILKTEKPGDNGKVCPPYCTFAPYISSVSK